MMQFNELRWLKLGDTRMSDAMQDMAEQPAILCVAAYVGTT
jgi:hypothetical protein